MSGICVLADEAGDVAVELAAFARRLGSGAVVALLSRAAAALPGVAIGEVGRLVCLRVPADGPAASTWAAAAGAVLDREAPQVLIAPFTWDTAAGLAGVAARRGLTILSDVTGASRVHDGALLVERPLYGDKVRATFEVALDRTCILLVRPGAVPSAEPAHERPYDATLELQVPPDERLRIVDRIAPDGGDVDLANAEVIFAVGRGLGTLEGVAAVAEAAACWGASLAASRPLVDVGLLPRVHQVGQSGLSVKPRVYVAFGISGAIQHVVGMAASGTIVALNTDPEAPIFDVAHVGAYADALEVARELARRNERA